MMTSLPAQGIAARLPEDALLAIFAHLPAETLAVARQVCRSFQRASCSKQLWLAIMQRDVLRRNLPMPAYCRHNDFLSSAECEALVVHSLCLYRTMRRGALQHPPVTISFPQSRSVTWVKLIRGQWLLVACSDRASSTLCLWSLIELLRSPGVAPPAAQTFLDGPVAGGLIDIQDDDRLVIALEVRAQSGTSVEIVSLLDTDDGSAFIRLRRFDQDVSHIRSLHGDRLAFALHRGRSLPSVLNWQTGKVTSLHDVPSTDGGAVAMALEDDLVAVVTPRTLQIWNFPCADDDDDVAANMRRSFALHHSVGFATCAFDWSLPGRSSRSLFVALSGHDGVFVYSIPVDQLRTNTLPDNLPPIWKMENADLTDATAKRRFDNPYRPLLGANGARVSWLSGCFATRPDRRRHVRFATLADSMWDTVGSPADVAEPVEYELHPDMPAMYAAGVYDYDDGLGLAVFGNAYGELALLDLAGLDLGRLSPCFKPICMFPPASGYEMMPQAIIPSTCFPPYPYGGPPIPPDDLKRFVMDRWRAQQPDVIPEGWGREGDVDADDAAIFALDWFYYVPRMPTEVEDLAWDLEHAWHFYGEPVPLVSNTWARIFSAGGLLFVWVVDDTLRVVHSGISFAQIAAAYRTPNGGPSLRREPDRSAFDVGARFYDCWLWECEHFGRNRWQELKDRGGDVDEDWTEDVPELVVPRE